MGDTYLDDWWVKVWTNYVTEFGIDGYRLDYRIFRPDLWERIRQNAAAAGHEIVIFEEDDAVIPGVTDFTQHDHTMRIPPPSSSNPQLNPHLINNVPGFYDRIFGRRGYYRVEIQYADDGSRVIGDTNGEGSLHVRLAGEHPTRSAGASMTSTQTVLRMSKLWLKTSRQNPLRMSW